MSSDLALEGQSSSRTNSDGDGAGCADLQPVGPWTRRVIVVLFVGSLIYLAFQAVVSAFLALDNATSFSGYALDGAFQLYNPLRRMEQGEIPGRDFPFFHGVGMPWLHFPLYALLGSNIFAAEMARWLLSPILFALSGIVFFRAMLGTWVRATIALAPFVAMSIIPTTLNLVDPGNSMAGIRAMTPLLIAAAMMWTVRRKRLAFGFIQWHSSLLAAYVLLGVGVALGTEQGIAAIGAFIVVRAVQNIRRLRWGWRMWAQTAIDAVAAATSTLLVLSVLTLGHAFDALRYALVDIPKDQGWVFGSIPNIVLTPESLLWELRAGPQLDLTGMVPGFLITGFVAFGLLVASVAIKATRPVALAASAFLWLYGLAVLAAIVGYISLPVQLAPFGRVSAAIACGAGTAIVLAAMARFEARIVESRSRMPQPRFALGASVAAAVAIVVVGVFFVVMSVSPRAELLAGVAKRQVIADALRGPFSSDYEVAGEGYRNSMDLFLPLIPEGSEIWATYSSLYNSERGVFTPAPGGEDYIIHALGQERRAAYQEAFVRERPDAVITTNPYYTIYEEWLWGRYPVFFRTLMENYTMTAQSGSHVLWLLNDAVPTPEPEAAATVGADGSFELPGNHSDRVVYYNLRVEYEADGGPFPVLNRLPRYYLRFEGAALALYGEVLPDNESSWSLVVPVFAGSPGVRVSPFIDGIHPFASLRIDGAWYQRMSVPQENDQLIEENFCSGNKAHERCTH